jgi:hypothetical protein
MPGIGQGAIMPIEPTDKAAGMSSILPVPPTTPSGPGISGTKPLLPSMPTTRTGLPASLSGGVQPPVMRPPAQFSANLQPPQNPTMPAEKPFPGYTPPPTTSPYGRQFLPTGGVTTSNYTTLVQPALNQANANQHFSAQIGGLQIMQQQRTPPGGGQEVPMGQGLANPNNFIYYNNTGGYFPTSGSPPFGQ